MERIVSRFNRVDNDPKPGVYNENTGEFLREINSPLWETDVVEFQGENYIVTGLNLNNTEGEEWRYDISESLTSEQYIANVQINELRLIERGNLWKKEHGEPLSFNNPLEEAEFYYRLGGEVEEIENPRGFFRWGFEEAANAIREGVADAFLLSSYTPLNRCGYAFVIKYKNRDVGERIRKYQIQTIEEDIQNRG